MESNAKTGAVQIITLIALPLVLASMPLQCNWLESKFKAEQESARRQDEERFQERLEADRQRFAMAQAEKASALEGEKLKHAETLGKLSNEIANRQIENQRSLGQGEIDAKLVQMCIDILRSEATQTNTSLRKWAVTMISRHSTVPIPRDAEATAIGGAINGKGAKFSVMVFVGSKPIRGATIYIRLEGSQKAYQFPMFSNEEHPVSMVVSAGTYELWAEYEGKKGKPVVFAIPPEDAREVNLRIPN